MRVNLHLRNPSYINTLIPGHVYTDESGENYIFLGYGTYYADDNKLGIRVPWFNGENRYFYLKEKTYHQLVNVGHMSSDLMYWGMTNKNYNIMSKFSYSQKPKNFVCDKGKMFPEDYFQNFVVTDCRYSKEVPPVFFYYHFETHSKD